MLSRIQTKNYRHLRIESGISFDNLTIFVGPNGSGKTNLVRVLRFFRDAITGSPDERRGVNSFEDAVARFGSGRILDIALAKPSVVSFALGFRPGAKYEYGFHVEMDVKYEHAVSVRQEQLYRISLAPPAAEKFYYYQAHVPSIGSGNAEYSFGEERHSIRKDVPTNELTFQHYSRALEAWLDSADGLAGQPEGVKADSSDQIAVMVQRSDNNHFYIMQTYPTIFLGSTRFYESSRMNLEEIRHSKPEPGPSDTLLSPSGDNLVLMLHNLIREDVDFEERMTEAMRELFPQTRRLRVLTVGRLTLSLEWYVKDSKKPFYFDEMSDGTVRMLCWAAVLLSPKRPSLIVLDEPEAGVHPAWLRVLAGWIREAARSTQVIVSTHSPDLLDYFTENIENVRVFHQDAEDPSYYAVSPLNREAIAEKLEEGWKLGDLYRVGDPGVGGWPW